MTRLASILRKGMLITIGLLSFELSGCQGGKLVSPIEITPPDIFRVTLSPSLDWLAPNMNMCALEQPNTGIVLVDSMSSASCFSAADICLMWGEGDYPPDAKIFQLGRDDLVFIVHSQNPVEALTREEMAGIYSTRIETWEQLGEAAHGKTGTIQVWVNPADTEMQNMAEKFTGEKMMNPDARIAPDPAAMRQAITETVDAIGYIPGRWLVESVHPIRVLDQPEGDMSAPVLAVLPSDPQKKMQEWLLCLQEAMQ